jgi:hypothetical protein
MSAMTKSVWSPLAAAIALAVTVSGAYSAAAFGADVKVTLSGDQEVPAVKTAATGSGTVTIGDDMSVKGKVTTTGIAGTAAHIHTGAAGKSGGVAVPMVKDGDNGWTFAAGAKLNDDQMKAFKAGELYVNVHSAANPGGEIRGQLKP